MRFFLLVLTTALLLLVRCSIETAKEPVSSYLHIATDVFKNSDSKLFDAFTKQTGIIIRFHQLTPDSLSAYIEQKKYLGDIDMALYSSPFQFESLRHKKQLTFIKSAELFGKSNLVFQTIVPLIQNPLCLIQVRDSSILKQKKPSLSKLFKQSLSTTLTKKEMHLMALSLSDKIDQKHMLSAIYKNTILFNTPIDVSHTKMLVLRHQIKKSPNRKRFLIKPLENPKNYASAAVLKNSKSYNSSIQFINYIKKDNPKQLFYVK